MIAFPLTLLALAAGTYLLLKAKKELMGKVFEWLAWLIIVLSILYMIALGLMGWHHRHMMRHGMMDRGMVMNHMGGRQGGMGNCCDYGPGNGCCSGMNTGGGSCCNACGMNMGCGGNGNCGNGGSCNMMMGHDTPACCMGDSAHGKDGKGACCMGAKPEEKKK